MGSEMCIRDSLSTLPLITSFMREARSSWVSAKCWLVGWSCASCNLRQPDKAVGRVRLSRIRCFPQQAVNAHSIGFAVPSSFLVRTPLIHRLLLSMSAFAMSVLSLTLSRLHGPPFTIFRICPRTPVACNQQLAGKYGTLKIK